MLLLISSTRITFRSQGNKVKKFFGQKDGRKYYWEDYFNGDLYIKMKIFGRGCAHMILWHLVDPPLGDIANPTTN
jgi:hypothetical protein